MDEVIFVTHNKGKIASAQKQLKEVNFKVFEYDLEEPRSDDITYISKYKVMEAYKMVNKPCISMDAGFWIDELDGFPRAFVNFALDTIKIDGILKLMEGIVDRYAYFIEALAYCEYGKDPIVIVSKTEGEIALEKSGEYGWSWDFIFIPKGENKTMGNFKDEDRWNLWNNTGYLKLAEYLNNKEK